MVREKEGPKCAVHDEKPGPIYKRKGKPQNYSRLVSFKMCHTCLIALIKKNRGEQIK